MCILLTTNAHPDYPFILISNRDEYFVRPTLPAQFHHDDSILSPFDLARPEHGTWIGTNRSGKLAVLVNYREELKISGDISRGLLPMSFLESDLDSKDWESSLTTDFGNDFFDKIGGFSLLFGELRIDEKGKIKPLNILSNRGDRGEIFSSKASTEIANPTLLDESVTEFNAEVFLKDGNESSSEIFGLSNSMYYNPWPKVKLGQELLKKFIDQSMAKKYNEQVMVDELFKIASHNTFEYQDNFQDNLKSLRNSIFIPPIKNEFYTRKNQCNTSGEYYGTRTQTVIFLNKKGDITYIERNLKFGLGEDDESYDENRFRYNIFDGKPIDVQEHI